VVRLERNDVERAPFLTELEAEICKRSFREYIRGAWKVVEPATPFVDNWHIGIICEYLTAINNGQLRNLIINIPPRCMKSLTVCVFYPTWVWTHSPAKRFLTSSYSIEYAVRDAVKSRRIITSPWYQQRFGDVYRLAGDQNVKSRYENDKTGHRIAVSVGGAATGEGGDIIIVDDPLKAQDAHSDPIRGEANDWWDKTMSTRGNDPKTTVRIVIMQRLHEDDLTGHLVEKMREEGAEQYEHLVLPMRHELKRFFSTVGLQDPRQESGELLWPERVPEVEVRKLEASLGNDAAGQLQQRPAPAGGSIFLSEWWDDRNRFDASDGKIKNLVVARWLSFDTALKDKEANDFTAMSTLELLPDYKVLLRLNWKKKLQFPQLASSIEAEARRWNYDEKLRGIIVEDKGSGTSALQTLSQSAEAGIAKLLIPFQPQGSKEYRARQASLWCDRGCVLLPWPGEDAEWLFDFEDGLYKFPNAAHDDDTDSFSQGILYLENLLAAGWQARNKGQA
jgi:predicted phage terminase large subunit-like protein